MSRRGLGIGVFVLMMPVAASAQDSSDSVTGFQRNVTFSAYSPLSGSVELARRTLSPLANLEVARASARLRPQAIDLTQESFSIYVPARHPSKGYALMAFIPPWQDAHLPAGWAAVFDEHGMIFVSAARSGNEENVIDRRIPLALLGAYNIMQRYPIDPDRVYIGGFSGGSRVAMRTALAYPDLFRGALLNAGSDPIGGSEALLPPDDLFAQFQSSTRLVYVTGSEDSWNIQHDRDSRDSMQAWCVFRDQRRNHVESGSRSGNVVLGTSRHHRTRSAPDCRSAKNSPHAGRASPNLEMAADLQHTAELIERDKPPRRVAIFDEARHSLWRSRGARNH